MTKDIKQIQDYNKAVQALAETFSNKYFDNDDLYWIGDDIGGICCIGDYFFTVDRMKEALELNASQDDVIDYYDLEVELGMEEKKPKLNFKNYVKHPEMRNK